MSDLIFIGVVIGFFPDGRYLNAALRETLGGYMETVIVRVIALLLFVYLFVAMIRPEKF